MLDHTLMRVRVQRFNENHMFLARLVSYCRSLLLCSWPSHTRSYLSRSYLARLSKNPRGKDMVPCAITRGAHGGHGTRYVRTCLTDGVLSPDQNVLEEHPSLCLDQNIEIYLTPSDLCSQLAAAAVWGRYFCL